MPLLSHSESRGMLKYARAGSVSVYCDTVYSA